MYAEKFNEGFLAFAKSKPADREYNPADSRNCALGQYVRTLGYEGHMGGFEVGIAYYMYPYASWEAALETTKTAPDMTFGDVVERLERFKAAGLFNREGH